MNGLEVISGTKVIRNLVPKIRKSQGEPVDTHVQLKLYINRQVFALG